MTTIHDRIAQVIAASRTNETAASIACKLDPSYIRKMREKQTSPSARTLAKLAIGLKTTAEWLAYGTGEPPVFVNTTNLETQTPLLQRSNEVVPRPRKNIWNGHDSSYIQVSARVLHRYVSGALQHESIPEEQADAYADAVLELIKGRTTAHVVLRLADELHTDPGSAEPGSADQSS